MKAALDIVAIKPTKSSQPQAVRGEGENIKKFGDLVRQTAEPKAQGSTKQSSDKTASTADHAGDVNPKSSDESGVDIGHEEVLVAPDTRPSSATVGKVSGPEETRRPGASGKEAVPPASGVEKEAAPRHQLQGVPAPHGAAHTADADLKQEIGSSRGNELRHSQEPPSSLIGESNRAAEEASAGRAKTSGQARANPATEGDPEKRSSLSLRSANGVPKDLSDRVGLGDDQAKHPSGAATNDWERAAVKAPGPRPTALLTGTTRGEAALVEAQAISQRPQKAPGPVRGSISASAPQEVATASKEASITTSTQAALATTGLSGRQKQQQIDAEVKSDALGRDEGRIRVDEGRVRAVTSNASRDEDLPEDFRMALRAASFDAAKKSFTLQATAQTFIRGNSIPGAFTHESGSAPVSIAATEGVAAPSSHSSSAPSPSQHAGHATTSSPGTQVAVKVSAEISGNSDANGSKTVKVRLHPEELGRVEVKLETQNGQTQVVVRAENPQALESLKADSRMLEQALKDAGLDLDGGVSYDSFNGEGDDQHESSGDDRNWHEASGDHEAEDVAPLTESLMTSDAVNVAL